MKLLVILVACLSLYVGIHLNDPSRTYQTFYDKPVVEAQPVSEIRFRRSFHENQSSICINNVTHEHYQGELVTKAETSYVISKAGFKGEQIEIMAAISRAESGSDMRCIGDETLTNSEWGISYGLFQVRTLRTQNKGCRDLSRLTEDLQAQADCAFQIWKSQGFRAWSVYSNGKYRQWLNKSW